MSSNVSRRGHSLLCREYDLSSMRRRSMSEPCNPQSSDRWSQTTSQAIHYTCNILLLYWYYTNTRYPLYRNAICHPMYREDDTLFCVENMISPLCGEGVCQNHAIRRAQTDGSRPQVKRYIILAMYYYYTSAIPRHYIPCTEMQYVIHCIEKRTLSSV